MKTVVASKTHSNSCRNLKHSRLGRHRSVGTLCCSSDVVLTWAARYVAQLLFLGPFPEFESEDQKFSQVWDAAKKAKNSRENNLKFDLGSLKPDFRAHVHTRQTLTYQVPERHSHQHLNLKEHPKNHCVWSFEKVPTFSHFPHFGILFAVLLRAM